MQRLGARYASLLLPRSRRARAYLHRSTEFAGAEEARAEAVCEMLKDTGRKFWRTPRLSAPFTHEPAAAGCDGGSVASKRPRAFRPPFLELPALAELTFFSNLGAKKGTGYTAGIPAAGRDRYVGGGRSALAWTSPRPSPAPGERLKPAAGLAGACAARLVSRPLTLA
jgi:hypothetical protein